MEKWLLCAVLPGLGGNKGLGTHPSEVPAGAKGAKCEDTSRGHRGFVRGCPQRLVSLLHLLPGLGLCVLGKVMRKQGLYCRRDQRSPRIKSPCPFFFPCSPLSPLLFVRVPCPFPLVPCLLLLVLWKREWERNDGNHMNKAPTNACQAFSHG